MSNKTRLIILALGAAMAFAGPAFADKMKATLDGKAEVPPNASAATGTADLNYDPASKKLNWKLSYTGLSGPATAAHFHGPAEAGKNAGVAVAIPNATSSPVEGSATLTDAREMRDILIGKGYSMGETLSWVEDDHGMHNEECWGRRMGEALAFMLDDAVQAAGHHEPDHAVTELDRWVDEPCSEATA